MECVAMLGFPLLGQATEPVTSINGARTASAEAMSAILRYGSADRYDLFRSTAQWYSGDTFGEELEARGITTQRVRVIPPQHSRQALSNCCYLAFHDTGSPFVGRIAAMTRPLVPEPTPCTCVHHSLSFGELLPYLLETCVSGLRSFDAIFCSSTDSRRALEYLLEHLSGMISCPSASRQYRLEHVPLGIDTAPFVPVLPHQVARQLLGLPSEGRYLLYLGRLSPFDKADLDALLRAFATLRHAPGGENLRLMLAGDDTQHYSVDLRTRARALDIAHVIHILSNVTATTKRLVLWAADVFVSPVDNVQESFGLAVVEAMAAGLPVVASDWGGYRDTVLDGETGFRIPTIWGPCTSVVDTQTELGIPLLDHLILGQSTVVDEDLLVDRLQRLLDDPSLRCAMGHQARKRALRFDWKAVVQETESLWRTLKREALEIGEARRPPVRFPYWQVFGHYPTYHLQAQDVVELGRLATAISAPPPPLQCLLPDGVLQRLRVKVAEGPQRVDTVVENETDLLGLLWLAKVGIVRIHKIPSLDPSA